MPRRLRALLFYAIGYMYALGMAVRLVWRFLTRPRSFFKKTDWASLELPAPVQDVTHHLLDVGGGVQIHAVRTGGAPEKPILLCVHGFPEYWGSWRHQMEAFRDRYDVVAIDMRGYAGSSKPEGVHSYHMIHLVNDIAGVIRALRAKQVTLMAHDWGGAVCWNVAHMHPELIDRLIIVCAPHPRAFLRNMDMNQFLRSWYMFFFQVAWLPELVWSVQDFDLVQDIMDVRTPGALSGLDVTRYKAELARPGALTAAINYYRAMGRDMLNGSHPALALAGRQRLQCKTLLLWADSDSALGPQLLRGIDRHVERLRVVLLPRCSHWAQQDKAEDFNQLVAGFLSEAE